MKSFIAPLIGKVTVIQDTDEFEVVQVDVNEALFSVIWMKNNNRYLDKTTLQPYRTKKSTYGSYTTIFIAKESFVTHKIILITLIHFFDNTFLSDIVKKSIRDTNV